MTDLKTLREQIDIVDEEILRLLTKRIHIMQQVGESKRELQLPIRDYQREKLKLADIQEQARVLHIPISLVRNMWKLFFEISEEVEL